MTDQQIQKAIEDMYDLRIRLRRAWDLAPGKIGTYALVPLSLAIYSAEELRPGDMPGGTSVHCYVRDALEAVNPAKDHPNDVGHEIRALLTNLDIREITERYKATKPYNPPEPLR